MALPRQFRRRIVRWPFASSSMASIVEVSPGAWNLVFRGVVAIEGESFDIVDGVRHYLDNPELWDASERCEVAAAIRALAVPQ